MDHGYAETLKQKNPQLPEINVDKPDELFYDESFEDYLSDKKCVSASGVLKVEDSPLDFLHWIAGDKDEEEKPFFRFGSAVHLAGLEPMKFRERYVVEPVFTGLTKDGKPSAQSKDAKEQRAKWRAAQKPDAVILTSEELTDLTFMIKNLMAHKQAANFFKSGKPEVTGRFTHAKTGIRCRIRPDYICEHGKEYFIFDLKTTRQPNKELFIRDAAQNKYDQKMAFYRDGMTKIMGRPPSAVALIGMKKSPPYHIWVCWLDEDDLAQCSERNDHALHYLKKSIETGIFPGQQTHAELVSMPNWRRNEPFPQFDYGGDL